MAAQTTREWQSGPAKFHNLCFQLPTLGRQEQAAKIAITPWNISTGIHEITVIRWSLNPRGVINGPTPVLSPWFNSTRTSRPSSTRPCRVILFRVIFFWCKLLRKGAFCLPNVTAARFTHESSTATGGTSHGRWTPYPGRPAYGHVPLPGRHPATRRLSHAHTEVQRQ